MRLPLCVRPVSVQRRGVSPKGGLADIVFHRPVRPANGPVLLVPVHLRSEVPPRHANSFRSIPGFIRSRRTPQDPASLFSLSQRRSWFPSRLHPAPPPAAWGRSPPGRTTATGLLERNSPRQSRPESGEQLHPGATPADILKEQGPRFAPLTCGCSCHTLLGSAIQSRRLAVWSGSDAPRRSPA